MKFRVEIFEVLIFKKKQFGCQKRVKLHENSKLLSVNSYLKFKFYWISHSENIWKIIVIFMFYIKLFDRFFDKNRLILI